MHRGAAREKSSSGSAAAQRTTADLEWRTRLGFDFSRTCLRLATARQASKRDLECGDTLPLSYEATCRLVLKRRHVRALQSSLQVERGGSVVANVNVN